MKKYEIMFIVRPNIEEEAKTKLVDTFTNVLTENNAVIETVDVVGLKTLAYEINDFRKGFYYIFIVNAGNEAINEFDRLARINEDIIRYIVIKDEE
jgi:small subunit ribosomal protein S6